MTNYIRRALVLAITAVAAACTITDTTPPPLAGPSGMALSLAITANPDVLSQDGGSQSLITIEARDDMGQPVASQLLYLEIEGGDFGTLSSRTVVTNSQGRATFTYTAPPGSGLGTTQNVAILVRPGGTDNATDVSRVVNIRLNPSGTIPTGAPNPSFTFVPEAPEAFIPVRFDGRASTASRGATITNYSWDFGDGTSGTGATASHTYSAPGTYGVRLTVTDSQGLAATSAAQVLTVEAGSTPTATYVFSPTEPVAGKPVFFNGTLSTPGPGHSLVRYRWNWGDGTSNGSGSTASHTFAAAGSYIVVLTVTDEVGQTATQSQTVDVQ